MNLNCIGYTLGATVLLLGYPIATALGADPFAVELGFTKTGWSPSNIPPPISWNGGFLMVDAKWPSNYTDKDDVTYEAWIESGTTDWASANMVKDKAGTAEVWRQKLYMPWERDGARKNVRFKMTFDFRRPGLSSALLEDAKGSARYETLPAAHPLPPGKYGFTCVITRKVPNSPPVIARKDFEVTITGEAQPVFVSGIANFQVYQRKNKAAGDVSFYFGGEPLGNRKVAVTVTKDNTTVVSKQFSTTQADELLLVPDVPVGGPYTITVGCDAVTRTFTSILVGDIWIVSGQSNAVGVGYDASLGRKAIRGVNGLSPKYGIYEWIGAADGFFEQTVGAWVTAAQDYYANTGVPVGLVGYAVGSKNMNYFMDKSLKELPYIQPIIERHGKNAALFLWYQGESDSFSPENCESYGVKLKSMADAVRRYTDEQALPIGIVQLAKYLWFKDDHFAPIREAQLQYVLQDPKAALYSTMPYEVNEKDKIHLVTKSYVELGELIGKHLSDVEKAGGFASPGPMVKSIKFSKPNHLEVVASFSNADGLNGGTDLNEWFVTDTRRGGFKAGGFVPIKNVSVNAESGQVLLELAEPAGAGAALSYGYRSDVGGTLRNLKKHPAPAFVKVNIQE